MYIDLEKTLAAIGKCILADEMPTLTQLRGMYELTHRLQSQILAVIYDVEHFGIPT